MTAFRSKQTSSATVLERTSRPALRHALRPSGMGIVRDHAAQSLQVGGRMAAVSDGQGELHHDEAVPMLDGASLRLALHVLQGHAVGEFARPEMDGLGLADADDQKNDAGNVGVAMRVHGQVFFVGHGSTVHAKNQPATITL